MVSEVRGESEMGLGICRVGSGVRELGDLRMKRGIKVCGSGARRCMEYGVLREEQFWEYSFRV